MFTSCYTQDSHHAHYIKFPSRTTHHLMAQKEKHFVLPIEIINN